MDSPNALLQCASCGFDSPEGMKFCGECGASLTDNVCPQCRFDNPLRFKFCGQCGTALRPSAHSPRPTSPASAPRVTNTAERRQLTVMFCDLVGSTALSERLDPEELREVVRSYQQVCAEVTDRFEGHIAQYLGDGLLIYFGYPVAHEDDPYRSVRAGLDIISQVQQLSDHLQHTHQTMQGIPLQVRIGIHTGQVVVGEMGGGQRREQLALGDTPNVAARVQGKADPDTVVISAITARLVEGFFTCQSLGAHELKGVSQAMELFQVLQESTTQSRFEVAVSKGLTPLVGREEEIQQFALGWQQAKAGKGSGMLLSGEAGVGKSRLVQVIREQAQADQAQRIECRCLPYYQSSAFYPVIDHLQRLLGWTREDTAEQKLNKLEHVLEPYSLPLHEIVPPIASLLSVPLAERYPELNVTPQKQKEKIREAIVTWVFKETERQPLLFVWEDIHWIDPSSLELVEMFLDKVSSARLLILLTARPEFSPPWQPAPHIIQTTLNRLDQDHVTKMVAGIGGDTAIPPEVVEQIVAKTDGVPLFVEEMTRMVLEAAEAQGQGALSSLSIPATLQDLLMARVDRLGTAKEIAQLGATIGRGFPYELIKMVSSIDEATLQAELDKLVAADALYQRGTLPEAQYTFKQALIQDSAYQALLKSTRQNYHQQIAAALEEHFDEIADTQPELVAHHYTQAGFTTQAIAHWLRAGQRAVKHSANLEAIQHFSSGLKLVEALPESPQRSQQELALLVASSLPLTATKGFASAELEQVFERARTLVQQVGESPQLFPLLRGLAVLYMVRAKFETASELGQQLLILAQNLDDEGCVIEAHLLLGLILLYRGEFALSRNHLEQAVALYHSEQHHALAYVYGDDPGVVCLAYLAVVLALQGYLDQARKRSQEAIRLARQVAHPFSLAVALNFAARLYQCCRDPHQTEALSEEALNLSTEQGFAHWITTGSILHGWALTELGHAQAGIAQLQAGLTGWQQTGAEVALSHFFAMQAEAYGKVGQIEKGVAVIEQALAVVEKNGERFFEAEVHRLKGELLLNDERRTQNAERQKKIPQASSVHHSSFIIHRSTEAEVCFQQAIALARRQEAKLWELRAALSLSRLWRHQGKLVQAQELLAGVLAWFTEGADLADVQAARTFLGQGALVH